GSTRFFPPDPASCKRSPRWKVGACAEKKPCSYSLSACTSTELLIHVLQFRRQRALLLLVVLEFGAEEALLPWRFQPELKQHCIKLLMQGRLVLIEAEQWKRLLPV